MNRASSSITMHRHYSLCCVYQFGVLCKINFCCQKKTVACLTVTVQRFCKVLEQAAAAVLKISDVRFICTSSCLDNAASHCAVRGLNIHRGNSRHSLLGPFRLAVISAAFATVAVCPELGSTRFSSSRFR